MPRWRAATGGGEKDHGMAAPLLEVIDVHKRYGPTPALAGVSFSVREGEMFGLLGPNGAGKTTLLSVVSLLMAPSAGEVRLLGRPVTPADTDARRLIGVVPQDLAVYATLTARENLHFFGELYGLRGDELRARVGGVLEAVGLADRADDKVQTFSGGMKRRLNLGAALVHGPRLLLLDEPTVGVDPQSRNHIFEGVRALNAAGTTVVYTSHYMEEVQALCPRVGIMDRGRLVACDTLPALLQQLPGLVRFRVAELTPALRERLKALADGRLAERPGGAVELECADVKATLLRLVALLNDAQVELLRLETEEPNLERVFLHLTGRALRD
jgi:ABC-2 type transport system ATP-binding protein